MQDPHERSNRSSRDCLGCLSSSLGTDQELHGSGLRLYRKQSDGEQVSHVQTAPTDRGYLLGLSLRAGHSRRILHPRQASTYHFDADSIYIRNFADPYRAELDGPFDFLLVELSRHALDALTDDAGSRRIDGLNVATGRPDPMLAGVMRALLPVLERPGEASSLFLQQMGLAIGTLVAERYGAMPAQQAVRARRLSRSQEARAKEMLRSEADANLSIAAIANACELSRSYFTQAFRETTGQTPHQFVIAQRIQRARELLVSTKMPLVDVASNCGFADQSHFTRVFARATGQPPARWRRLHGA